MNRTNFKKSIILILVLALGITTLVGFAQSQNGENKSNDFDNNRNLIRIFRLVNSLNEEAEKQDAKGFAKRAEMLRNHLQKKTGISNEAKLKLNELAANFQKESEKINAEIKEVHKNQKNKPNDEALRAEFEKLGKTRNKLFDSSRESLKNNFAIDDSEKVLKFLREVILEKIKNSGKARQRKSLKNKSEQSFFEKISFSPTSDVTMNSFMNGYSVIYYDSESNEVWGVSTTDGNCWNESNEENDEQNFECAYLSVDAVLSNSESGINTEQSATNDSTSVEAYVYGIPNISGEYCVDAEHNMEDNEYYTYYSQSSDCINVELPQEISSLEFEEINSPIDDNPKYGNYSQTDGKRIFPDKQTPSDTTNRATVRIKATISPAVENVEVYFKTFDLDDPSSNALPLDDETLAEDNRGDVNGNKEGVLGAGGNTITAATDSNGVASVVLTVTKHPGDNFAVAASKDGNYLANVSVQGVELKNGSQTVSTSGTTPQNPAIRTEMLTVWRKLHIEVDDMGTITNNKETGTISSATLLGGTAIELKLDKVLDEKRFQPGKIVVDNTSPGSFNVVTQNEDQTATYITISSTLSASSFIGKGYTLYDDDDFNNNGSNGGNLGDIGEDVAPLSDTLSRIQTSDNPNENIYAYAYIMPVQDGGGDASFVNHDVYFSRNNSASGDSNGLSITAQIGQGRDSNSNESNDFWVAYVQIAYQGDAVKDGDPNFALSDNSNDVGGQTPAVTADSVSNASQVPSGGQGSLIYIETLSDYVRSRGFNERGLVVAHEIGHQFGINGDGVGQGVMNGSTPTVQTGEEKFIPLHINVMRWRVKSPGM